MEFIIEKCGMLIMINEKRIKLPNQEKIRTLGEKETYKYLCKTFKFDRTSKWWMHKPESILVNET